jgi:hypothetical protein
MKMVTKLALLLAVAGLALAGASTDSMARGHKRAAAACMPGALKTAACNGNVCSMQRCWADGKWHPSVMWCWQPWCPK